MSESNEGQVPNPENTTETPESPQVTPQGSGITTLEDALKELQKVRQEAASKRITNKEQEKELEEFKQWKESQMTEVEKLQARVNEASSEAKEGRQLKAAKAAGLDLDLAGFLSGDTQDELNAMAKVLAEKLGGTEPQTPQLPSGVFAGQRGEPISNSNKNADDRANQMIAEMMGLRKS